MSNLYLGLGGAGIDAVKAVYERSLSEKDSCNKNQYLLIDTDIYSKKSLPEVLQKTFIEIGSKSPDQIKEETLSSPQKEWFLDWYDYYECDHSLNDGTGTVRPYGRIALLSKYDEVYHRLSSALCELERGLATEELLNVIVFTGSCGGTGSAITLDILYMIRTIMMSGADSAEQFRSAEHQRHHQPARRDLGRCHHPRRSGIGEREPGSTAALGSNGAKPFRQGHHRL